jgi:hypothetical protein
VGEYEKKVGKTKKKKGKPKLEKTGKEREREKTEKRVATKKVKKHDWESEETQEPRG